MSIINIDVIYLKNVYFLKMNNLVALEVNLVNNNIDENGLMIIIEKWSSLKNLTWIMFDLIGNEIESVDLNDILKEVE